MLATLTDDRSNTSGHETSRMLLHTSPPDPETSATMPSHNPILHDRYKRTSISKPLYTELSDSQFRLLRIVPGTRRGEFTAQMFETDLTEAGTEYEYSILALVPRSETEEARKDRRRSSSGNEDDDLTYFPILSLGGGEHQIEIPSQVKRALERVVEGRWDCFHSTRYSHEARRMWRSKSNSDHDRKGDGNLQLNGTAERDLRQEDGEVEAKDHDDEDGESDTGEGEDFYLWIQDICVDRTDVSDQRQQDKLFGKTCEGAKEIIVANVPHDMSGRIEIERLPNLGSAKNISDAFNVDAVQEAYQEMRIRKEVEEGKYKGGMEEEEIEKEVQRRKGPIIIRSLERAYDIGTALDPR